MSNTTQTLDSSLSDCCFLFSLRKSLHFSCPNFVSGGFHRINFFSSSLFTLFVFFSSGCYAKNVSLKRFTFFHFLFFFLFITFVFYLCLYIFFPDSSFFICMLVLFLSFFLVLNLLTPLPPPFLLLHLRLHHFLAGPSIVVRGEGKVVCLCVYLFVYSDSVAQQTSFGQVLIMCSSRWRIFTMPYRFTLHIFECKD